MIAERPDSLCIQRPDLALRRPEDVMRLEALGASFAHRLSFKRTLIRALHDQKADMQITNKQLDDSGHGHVVLTINFYGRPYSLIGYSRPLADEDRTDRVIATAWDASFCLFDGVPDAQDIAYLADEVTHQEAGHYHEKVMTLSRANKSVRLFEHVVSQLAKGSQPDHDMIAKIGYLMRTTAVYGNGKFGIADRDHIKDYDGLAGPFRAEMLTVFLIREFTFILADHCASCRGGDMAVSLSAPMRRNLGVGNSTGLGMAPFLIHHPNLFHSWILVRETAIARVRQIADISADKQTDYLRLYDRISAHLAQWQVDDESYQRTISLLRSDWKTLGADIKQILLHDSPFERLMSWAMSKGDDMAALMGSFIMEYMPEVTDGLEDCMTQARDPAIEPKMTVETLSNLMKTHYQWALSLDLTASQTRQQFWYVSEEKLEPRLGDAYREAGQDREMPFAMAYYVDALQQALKDMPGEAKVAELLLRHPSLRYIVRRIQNVAHFAYAEVHGNLVGASCRPIDLLRCKLSFFGASKFDPRSDRWTRITLYQGAPTAADLHDDDADDWAFWVVKDPKAQASI
ncbi:MAG: hypothetical protein ACON49_06070 [Candidatus Puniceispirillaceae bacterium]